MNKSVDCGQFITACSEVLRIAENTATNMCDDLNDEVIPNINDSVFDETRQNSLSEVRRALVFSSSSIESSARKQTVSAESSGKSKGVERDPKESTNDHFMIDVIDYMVKLIEAKQKEAKAEKDYLLNMLYETSAEFSSLKSLDDKVRNIENLNLHLSKIIAETGLLKDKLQNPVLHNTLHIKVQYHRSVVEFFQCATTLMNELENNKSNLEWILSKNFNCFTMEPYLTNLCESVVKKRKALDLLEGFHSSLQKLYKLSKHTSFVTDHL